MSVNSGAIICEGIVFALIRIKLSTSFPEWPLERQTSGSCGIWGHCQFFINQDVEECDYWVVFDNIMSPETTNCPPQNTILITGEPPIVKSYSFSYLKQFSTVISPHRELKHANVLHLHPMLPWHVGRRVIGDQNISFSKDYDELCSIKSFEKEKVISVITSNKSMTKGHRQRLIFVEKLKSYFGSQIDFYGRGFCDIEDKWDAIAPYKYHVAIENSCSADYWSEKLADTYLAGAYPIYSGCPNISDYFPPRSFTSIDICDFSGSIAMIETLIKEDQYDKSFQELKIARDLVLNTHNVFAVLACLCAGSVPYDKKEHVRIYPERQSLLRRAYALASRTFSSSPLA